MNLINSKAILEKSIERLEKVISTRSYTIKEMMEIRKAILMVVREGIDPYALGHAPEKRHY